MKNRFSAAALAIIVFAVSVFQGFAAFADSGISGNGSKEDPYVISSLSGLSQLSEMTAGGNNFKGKYIELKSDISLPLDFTPIGQAKKVFSGNFNGNGHTVTVAFGSDAPLFGSLNNATVQNLKIYGKKISSYGLVKSYSTNQSFTLENITIKSGTHTLFSGLVGGYGNKSVIINNCVAEKGVVIGDDGTYSDWASLAAQDVSYPWGPTGVKANDMIGSFAGAFNGTVTNCVSYAKVTGRDYVGGIIGFKGQSMRDLNVKNCKFYGEVTGRKYVGGIIGSGYYAVSAPNSLGVVVENCFSSGKVSGDEAVGGILGGDGGVAQFWANGPAKILNNHFEGTVSGNKNVGAIIGYMRSLNKYTVIENNTYSCSVKTNGGIGGVWLVDTDCETRTDSEGVLYINTANGVLECPSVSGCAWKSAHNRSDDPLGKDISNLFKVTHSFAKEIKSEKYLKSGTLGSNNAVYFKSCECGEKGTESFSDSQTVTPNNDNYSKSPKTGESVNGYAVIMFSASLLSLMSIMIIQDRNAKKHFDCLQ